MFSRRQLRVSSIVAPVILALSLSLYTAAQQTLGGITGTVTDPSGSVLPDVQVTAVADQTGLTRSVKTDGNGSYLLANLPIGNYTLTFTRDGFNAEKTPGILLQADRTVTLNAQLKVGSVNESVTVQAEPMLNAVDTTNGYILDTQQIKTIPLATGSFTQLAVLSPGVNAELLNSTGSNSGLGNQPIWANGQRDTSNTFLLNGVDATNLFNGKSTSQVASYRVVLNTGTQGPGGGGDIQSSTSVYLAIGQALPTPPPETIEELRVNTSMYDTQQGSTNGAHIDISTKAGTNDWHGELYGNRETNWLNAAPFFYKSDPTIPDNEKNPDLHRWTAGGTFGGPIIKNKLFGFLAYQHVHVSDQATGISRLVVPPGLTDDRSNAALINVANADSFTSLPPNTPLSPVATALFNYKLPNGQYLVPSDQFGAADLGGALMGGPIRYNASIPGTARFKSDHVVGDVDWNASQKDTLSLKYFYQHDPGSSPYAFSNVSGFSQFMDAGSQVGSINNAVTVTKHFFWTQTLGLIRMKAYNYNDQLFNAADLGINLFNLPTFPGINIGNLNPAIFGQSISIGPGGYPGGFTRTGVFQNRIMPATDATWTAGKHTLTFGASFPFTQLNIRNNKTDTANISSCSMSQFITGVIATVPAVSPYDCTSNLQFIGSNFYQGNANRYYRANDQGLYVQDKFQVRSNMSLTLGLRFDRHGGMTEKYGNFFNFDPARYAYDFSSNTILNNGGFVVAGNNPNFHTPGVSASTLTGRQWGFAPRIGFAYSPRSFNDKFVIRGGAGMYYDRGELFSYLSPGAGGAISGPFGVTQEPPLFVPTPALPGATLSNPFGTTRPAPPTANPATFASTYLPNIPAIEAGAAVYPFGDYNAANKLPYTINYTLDLQYQPRPTIAIDIGYVGNTGHHEVIPIPFNQAQIATTGNPVNGQKVSYGYQVTDASTGKPLLSEPFATADGGNTDLRVPYIGYGVNSVSYTTNGNSNYNGLLVHVEKRMTHGFQGGFSYTYSHALDEQSALGLFYTGNNPQNVAEGYGSSDFDRTHVFTLNMSYTLPNFVRNNTVASMFTNGWGVQGTGVFQSGQPYSVIDYSGAAGGVYYSTNDGITNPILPLAPGFTPKTATTGKSGAFGLPALNPAAFTIPLLSPGQKGVPACDPDGACDVFETDFANGYRNVFRQSFQKVFNLSFVKNTRLTERFNLKYTFDIFNLTNTPSFDIPGQIATVNGFFNPFPTYTPGLSRGANIASLYSVNPSNLTVTPASQSTLGLVSSTIGAPRNIMMSLHLLF
ncbi:MAG TPA: carboxypeptidase regulatory-like domain-containing protein [Terriglobales bacterium]